MDDLKFLNDFITSIFGFGIMSIVYKVYIIIKKYIVRYNNVLDKVQKRGEMNSATINELTNVILYWRLEIMLKHHTMSLGDLSHITKLYDLYTLNGGNGIIKNMYEELLKKKKEGL